MSESEREIRRLLEVEPHDLMRLIEFVKDAKAQLAALTVDRDTLRAETERLEKALEASEAHAIHGWSEVDHQVGHKNEYIEMLEAAEASLTTLRASLAAVIAEMTAYPRIEAEFHSGDREPGTVALAVSRAVVDRWHDQLTALLGAEGRQTTASVEETPSSVRRTEDLA